MPRRSSKPKRDINQIAAHVVRQSTGGTTKRRESKNPAAVALGRLGGLKGGKARAASLSDEERSQIARAAAQARWQRMD